MLRRYLVLSALFCVHIQARIRTTTDSSLQVGDSCRTISGKDGQCSLIHHCDSLLTKKINYTELGRCSFAGRHELICCPPEDAFTTKPPFIQPRWFDDNEVETAVHDEAPKRRPSKIACDVFSEKVPDRITSGNSGQKLAFAGQFGHIGAMLYYSNSSYDIRCQASLISERFALTAAACVDGSLPSLVRFGLIQWNSNARKDRHVDARIKKVYMHGGYTSGSPMNDIALLEFTKDVAFSLYVNPACLHSETEDLPPSLELQVAGWSKMDTTSNIRIKSSLLLSANLTTVGLDSCVSDYKNYLQLKKFQVDSHHRGLYCAIDFSKGFSVETCYGDPGGALVFDTEELWQIVGVASYANPCGIRLPNVFTRVAHYLDWIESVVWPEKLPPGQVFLIWS